MSRSLDGASAQGRVAQIDVFRESASSNVVTTCTRGGGVQSLRLDVSTRARETLRTVSTDPFKSCTSVRVRIGVRGADGVWSGALLARDELSKPR